MSCCCSNVVRQRSRSALEQARALLLRCRTTFEQQHDIEYLGLALHALADVEHRRGHGERAIGFQAAALRHTYNAGTADHIHGAHFNLADYLRRHGGDPPEAIAHGLAAAIIAYQTGSGGLAVTLRALAVDTRATAAAADLDWDEVCELTGRTEGVDLAGLVARLPARAPDGLAALAEVLRLAAEFPPEPAPDLDRAVEGWTPVLSALLAARAGDTRAAELLALVLTAFAQRPDWAALSGVLGRLAAGARGPDLLNGLDAIDTAIAQRALDALDGRAEIDPDAWHALAPAPDDDDAAGEAGPRTEH